MKTFVLNFTDTWHPFPNYQSRITHKSLKLSIGIPYRINSHCKWMTYKLWSNLKHIAHFKVILDGQRNHNRNNHASTKLGEEKSGKTYKDIFLSVLEQKLQYSVDHVLCLHEMNLNRTETSPHTTILPWPSKWKTKTKILGYEEVKEAVAENRVVGIVTHSQTTTNYYCTSRQRPFGGSSRSKMFGQIEVYTKKHETHKRWKQTQ